MRLWLLLSVLFGSAALADDPAPLGQAATAGFGSTTEFPESRATSVLTSSSARLAGDDDTGFGDLPTGSSSLGTGGSPSSVPEAGFSRGSTVTPAAPSTVPGFNAP
jgi:hypothetical protein